MSIFFVYTSGINYSDEWSGKVKYLELINWGLEKDIIMTFDTIKVNDAILGRVIEVQKGKEKVVTEEGIYWSTVSGSYRYNHVEDGAMPTVGDWVQVTKPISGDSQIVIMDLIPRKTKFSRKVSGTKTEEQLIAANIDIIFICMAMNGDFNIRRLERYVSLAWQSGAVPVIVLTKSDLCEDIDLKHSEIESLFIGVDIYVTCGFNDEDLDRLRQLIPVRKTAVFTGSSGVGKSTLINGLIGAYRQKTKTLRNDDQGRHTTTYRELLLLEGGGILVDTPGMREIGLLGDEEEGLRKSFLDIGKLMTLCKFNNCTHKSEVGCRVIEAIDTGELDKDRYDGYLKLLKESQYMHRMNSKHEQKAYGRAIGRASKSNRKQKY